MTCRRTRKLIPLYAGDDLRPRVRRAVGAHIESCPGCGRELEEYRQAMSRVKASAGAESDPDWSEAEWRTLMVRVAAAALPAQGKVPSGFTPVFKPRWAAATVLGMSIGLAVLSMLFRDAAFGPGSVMPSSEPATGEARREQDLIAMTLVSPETGLQVVWFFNKNFEWEGDKN